MALVWTRGFARCLRPYTDMIVLVVVAFVVFVVIMIVF